MDGWSSPFKSSNFIFQTKKKKSVVVLVLVSALRASRKNDAAACLLDAKLVEQSRKQKNEMLFTIEIKIDNTERPPTLPPSLPPQAGWLAGWLSGPGR